MRQLQSGLLSASLVLGGFLVFCGTAPAADQNSPRKPFAAQANAALASDAPAPLLLDRGPAAGQNNPQLDISPRQPRDELRPIPVEEMRVALEVLVEGKPLRTVSHAGKTYLPVPRPGAEYDIRVWNHGSRRVVALVSVDGLSVITGQPASEAQPGYVVAPHSSLLIKGWRRSLETVAAFRFVEREQSYAALMGNAVKDFIALKIRSLRGSCCQRRNFGARKTRQTAQITSKNPSRCCLMGHPENVGVIGLVAIEEQVWRPRPQLEKLDKATPPTARAGEVGSIGTEYGREVDSRVYYVPFVRSANRRTGTLYYDTVEALRKAGVPVGRPHPDPFPGNPPFAPPPPGYKGGKTRQ